MENIRNYLVSVIAVAVLGSIAMRLLGKKGMYSHLIKLISGILLAVVVVSPIVHMDFSSINSLPLDINDQADVLVTQGTAMAIEEERSFIKAGLEAYILDKAAACNIDITVDVMLSDANPPVPVSVQLHGAVSPYAKSRMTQYMTEVLSIPEENQLWN